MKNKLIGTVGLIMIVACFIGFGIIIGFMIGYDKAGADRARFECASKYNNSPMQNISGECLKYFYAGSN